MQNADKNRLRRKVSEREKDKLDPDKQNKQVWFGIGMFGVVGWSIAIPAVVATFIGIWMDSRYSGRYSWTLMLFMAGLCLGCYNAWYWMAKERREISKNNGDKNK